MVAIKLLMRAMVELLWVLEGGSCWLESVRGDGGQSIDSKSIFSRFGSWSILYNVYITYCNYCVCIDITVQD